MNRYLMTDFRYSKRYFNYDVFNTELGEKQILQRINLIDEPVMRQALMNEYRKTFSI